MNVKDLMEELKKFEPDESLYFCFVDFERRECDLDFKTVERTGMGVWVVLKE